jgi:nitric oxide reductase NorE protein
MITNVRTLEDPPGGVLMWLIVTLELVTFGIAFVMMGLFRAQSPAAFAEGQSSLSTSVAAALTLVLLTSGALAAEAVHAYREGKVARARGWLWGAIASGFGFVALKVIDTRAHLAAGHRLGSSDFWDAYFLGTGFHFLHVLVGLALLVGVALKLRGREQVEVETVAAVALFWHLCDVAWFFLLPMFFARSA